MRKLLRRLGSEPWFWTTATLTLALGLGLAGAMSSVLYSALWAPPVFTAPERMVLLEETFQGEGFPASRAVIRRWRDDLGAIEAVGYHRAETLTLDRGGETAPVRALGVSHDFLEALGVTPVLGRGFAAEEAVGSGAPVAVLGWDFWRTELSGSPDVVGRDLVLDGVAHRVVGVLPEGVEEDLVQPVELLVPRAVEELGPTRVTPVVARLRPGIGLEGGREELEGLVRRMAERDQLMDGWGARMTPWRASRTAGVRPALLVLQAAALLIVLIGCVNVGHLFLLRAERRQAETSVRLALGASRGGILRSALGEVALLLGAATALGVMAGRLLVPAVVGWAPEALARRLGTGGGGVGTEWVVPFVSGSVLAALYLGGLAVILHRRSLRVDPGAALRMGRGPSRGAMEGRSRLIMAVEGATLALAVCGVALSLSGLRALDARQGGLASGDVVTATVTVGSGLTAEERSTRFTELLEGLGENTMVVSTGSVSTLPLAGVSPTTWHVVESAPDPPRGEEPFGAFDAVDPGYFETVGLRILEGRAIGPEDGIERPPVVLVDVTAAERYWPDRSPVGDRVRTGPVSEWARVVGVVEATPEELDGASRPHVYGAAPQTPSWIGIPREIVVRARPGHGDALRGELPKMIRGLEPASHVLAVRTMEEVARGTWRWPLFQTLLMMLFGTAAAGLAVVGVVGVTAYVLAGRRRELALRLAVGAPRGRLVVSAIGRVVVWTMVGAAFGAGLAAAGLRAVEGSVTSWAALPGVTVAAALGLTLLTVILAALGPALRGARVAPAAVLRES